MKEIHKLKVLLDSDMTLEAFLTLINGALKTSDYGVGSGYKGCVQVLQANKFQIKSRIYGNDHIIELVEDII